MAAVSVKNLSFAYPECPDALKDISFEVNSGEFVLLCGPTGSGKTTLLRLLKREIAPHGIKSGVISISGSEQSTMSDSDSACKIGYVCQDADSGIVTDKVWHELAFGLESIGVSQDEMHRRVGEIATYFGIEQYLYQDTDTLSGGQKQLLSLASVLIMNPDILLLDEPISQLDPIAANEFTDALVRINSDFGVTVIISEHRTDALYAIADKVLLMDGGRLTVAVPQQVHKYISSRHLPTPMRIAAELSFGIMTTSVKDCRSIMQQKFSHDVYSAPETITHETVLTAKNISFRYTKDGKDILNNACISLCKSECLALLGGNGHGKTTLLKVLSGVQKAYGGKVICNDKIAMLPQNTGDVFIYQSIKDDLLSISKDIDHAVDLLGISALLDRHPADLSGGEKQKCAIAKLLLTNPKVMLLDEPTKSLDADAKDTLCNIINTLKTGGISVLLVTHDLEFAAASADRCAMLFDGRISEPVTPCEFFTHSRYFTTTATRIAHGIFDGAITADAVIEMGKKQL